MDAYFSVLRTIKENGLIEEGDSLLLGLSGGPDSLSLLHILAELSPKLGFKLYALHLNHLMRGDDAEADVKFLEEECAKLEVPLTVVRCDVYEKARLEEISVEEAGRAARHSALRARADELAAKIVFAHNSGDQAETVLMRVFRGTGVHGLAAMEYKRDDGVIRPLLDTPRKEIEAYCTKHSLKPRFDSTNKSEDYTRNRLRLHLFPQLEKEYNPNLKDVLFRLSENARRDDDFILSEANNRLSELVISDDGSTICLDAKKLRKLHPAVMDRIIILSCQRIGLTRDIAYPHLKSLEKCILENVGGKTVELPHGYKAKTSSLKLTLRSPESLEK